MYVVCNIVLCITRLGRRVECACTSACDTQRLSCEKKKKERTSKRRDRVKGSGNDGGGGGGLFSFRRIENWISKAKWITITKTNGSTAHKRDFYVRVIWSGMYKDISTQMCIQCVCNSGPYVSILVWFCLFTFFLSSVSKFRLSTRWLPNLNGIQCHFAATSAYITQL